MQPLNAGAPDERRAHSRTPCSYGCKIARYKRGVLLTDLEFAPARINDLSAGGFSFWTAQWPQLAELAFLLTDYPEAGVLLAHVRKVQHSRGRFMVRCQFIRQLSDSVHTLASD